VLSIIVAQKKQLSYNILILYLNHAFSNKATDCFSQIKAHINTFFVLEIIFFPIIKLLLDLNQLNVSFYDIKIKSLSPDKN
jgi:hypothetical protein